MSLKVEEFNVKSSDGVHTLKGKIYLPYGEIKGLFHIVHGMTEHIGRYDRVMSMAAQQGYICYGYDNLGHGRTALDDSELGFIAEKDGWKRLTEDVMLFDRAVTERYGNIPLCLMGHSMGSFIARLAAAKYPDMYNKLIICGTAGKNPLAPAGLFLTGFLARTKGEKYVSDFCINLAFGSYNRRFPGGTDYEWLTSDREIIEKYMADKYCTFKFTVSALHDLIMLITECNREEWFRSIPQKMPVLLISGEMDPVGGYGKGVREVYGKLKKQNCDVSMKLYPHCRHEILNDTCRQEAISDILYFLRNGNKK